MHMREHIWHIIEKHLAHQRTSGTSEHIWHIGTHLAHRRIHLAHLAHSRVHKTSASYHYRWAHSFVFIKDIIEFAIRGSVTAV